MTATDLTSEPQFDGRLLRNVSRSFYLTMRILPAGMRAPVATAYLLARAADTLADTAALAPAQRLNALHLFRKQIEHGASSDVLAQIQQAPAEGLTHAGERILLSHLPQLFARFQAHSMGDQIMIRSVVDTLTGGMVFDLETFPSEESGEIGVLPDQAALDFYTYSVAGCVGRFWTQMSIAHVAPLSGWDETRFSDLGIRYGQALQLTNILRDLPKDLRIGRCYLPQSLLDEHGLDAGSLLVPGNADAAGPLLASGISLALNHYKAAAGYLTAIPRRCIRLRLAALWPQLIGLATLARLAQRSDEWLDPEQSIKVDRSWVYRMMLRSFVCVGSNVLLQRWIDELRRQVYSALK